MKTLLIALQLSAAGLLPPNEQLTLSLIARNCNNEIHCMARNYQAGKVEVTESGVTVFRGGK